MSASGTCNSVVFLAICSDERKQRDLKALTGAAERRAKLLSWLPAVILTEVTLAATQRNVSMDTITIWRHSAVHRAMSVNRHVFVSISLQIFNS